MQIGNRDRHHGGYAALQSTVVEPTRSRGDRPGGVEGGIARRQQRRRGLFGGPHIREGSPTQNAGEIKVRC